MKPSTIINACILPLPYYIISMSHDSYNEEPKAQRVSLRDLIEPTRGGNLHSRKMCFPRTSLGFLANSFTFWEWSSWQKLTQSEMVSCCTPKMLIPITLVRYLWSVFSVLGPLEGILQAQPREAAPQPACCRESLPSIPGNWI